MRWPVLVGLAPLVAVSLAGCAQTQTTGSNPQPLVTFTAGVEAQDAETVVLAYDPQMGYVRATRQVLAGLGSPLEPAPGPNRTVEACRRAAWEEATKLGGHEIEAVSAGPEHVDKKTGQAVGPVRMRISYRKGTGSYSIYEVREATLTCTVDREGKIIQAT